MTGTAAEAGAGGHAEGGRFVEHRVTTRNHSDDRADRLPRPALCLRHHVWMAACDDCRDAHAALLTRRAGRGPAPR